MRIPDGNAICFTTKVPVAFSFQPLSVGCGRRSEHHLEHDVRQETRFIQTGEVLGCFDGAVDLKLGLIVATNRFSLC